MQQFKCSVAAAMLIWPCLAWANDMPPTVPLCMLCHGQFGPSPYPGVPTIHGLPMGVISNALFKYRDGERPCRKSECASTGACPDLAMCDIAGPMNDEDIEALSRWYADQLFVPHQDAWDPELAAKGRLIHDRYCEICHSKFGSDPVDDASMLRGQRKAYLRAALEDFRQGRRSVGLAAMDARFRDLADEDLDALAEFYSGAAAEPLLGE